MVGCKSDSVSVVDKTERERETSTTTTTAAHTLVAFGVIKARCKLDMQMQSNEATFNDGSSHTAH